MNVAPYAPGGGMRCTPLSTNRKILMDVSISRAFVRQRWRYFKRSRMIEIKHVEENYSAWNFKLGGIFKYFPPCPWQDSVKIKTWTIKFRFQRQTTFSIWFKAITLRLFITISLCNRYIKIASNNRSVSLVRIYFQLSSKRFIRILYGYVLVLGNVWSKT